MQKLYAMPDEEIYDYMQFLQEATEQVVVLGQPYLAPLRDPKCPSRNNLSSRSPRTAFRAATVRERNRPNWKTYSMTNAKDLAVMQTAECAGMRMCPASNDKDFHDRVTVAFCSARGIAICREATLLARLLP